MMVLSFPHFSFPLYSPGSCSTVGLVGQVLWAQIPAWHLPKAQSAASCSVDPPAEACVAGAVPGAVRTPSPPRPGRGPGRAVTDFGENVGLLFKEVLYLVLYIRPLMHFFPRKWFVGCRRAAAPGGPRTSPAGSATLAPSVDF